MRCLLVILLVSGVAEGAGLANWAKKLPVVAGLAILTTCGSLACQRDGVRIGRHYLDQEIRDLAGGNERILGLRKSDSFQPQAHDGEFYDGMAVHLVNTDGHSLIGRVASAQKDSLLIDLFASPDELSIEPAQISGVLVASFGKRQVTNLSQTIVFVDDVPIPITNHELLLNKGWSVSVKASDAQVIASELLEGRELANADRFDGIEYLHFSDDQLVIRVMAIIDHQDSSRRLQNDELVFVIADSSSVVSSE